MVNDHPTVSGERRRSTTTTAHYRAHQGSAQRLKHTHGRRCGRGGSTVDKQWTEFLNKGSWLITITINIVYFEDGKYSADRDRSSSLSPSGALHDPPCDFSVEGGTTAAVVQQRKPGRRGVDSAAVFSVRESNPYAYLLECTIYAD